MVIHADGEVFDRERVQNKLLVSWPTLDFRILFGLWQWFPGRCLRLHEVDTEGQPVALLCNFPDLRDRDLVLALRSSRILLEAAVLSPFGQPVEAARIVSFR